jgi:hypothetical protein
MKTIQWTSWHVRNSHLQRTCLDEVWTPTGYISSFVLMSQEHTEKFSFHVIYCKIATHSEQKVLLSTTLPLQVYIYSSPVHQFHPSLSLHLKSKSLPWIKEWTGLKNHCYTKDLRKMWSFMFRSGKIMNMQLLVYNTIMFQMYRLPSLFVFVMTLSLSRLI